MKGLTTVVGAGALVLAIAGLAALLINRRLPT